MFHLVLDERWEDDSTDDADNDDEDSPPHPLVNAIPDGVVACARIENSSTTFSSRHRYIAPDFAVVCSSSVRTVLLTVADALQPCIAENLSSYAARPTRIAN